MQGSHAGHPTQHSPTILKLRIMPGVSRFGAITRLPQLAPTLHKVVPVFFLIQPVKTYTSRTWADSALASQRHVSDRAEPSHRS